MPACMQSDALHDELIGIEQEMFTELGLHFKVLDMPSGDLGAPAYRKYDVEAWMPGLNRCAVQHRTVQHTHGHVWGGGRAGENGGSLHACMPGVCGSPCGPVDTCSSPACCQRRSECCLFTFGVH